MIMKDLILTAVFFLMMLTSVSAQSTTKTVGESKSIHIQVYPNPTTSFFKIEAHETQIKTIYLYNLIGKRVKTFEPSNGPDFYVDDLLSGMYLVQVLDDRGQIIGTSRLTKR